MGLLDDLEKIIKRQDEIRKDRSHVMYVSGDQMDFMNAWARNDEKEMQRISDEISKRAAESKRKDLECLQVNLSPEEFNIYQQIDSTYKKWGSAGYNMSTSGIQVYSYYWTVESVKIPYLDYGKFKLHILYGASKFTGGKGVYSLYIYYCNEDGYDQGYHYLYKNIEPAYILDLIEEVKKQYSV